MRLVVYPWSKGTSLIRGLRQSDINYAVRYADSTRYRPRRSDIILNWGNSHLPQWSIPVGVAILNHPSSVGMAVDKRHTFDILARADVHTPPHTTDRRGALAWLDEGRVVIARATTTGRAGRGITVHTNMNDLPSAPLYTLYVKKSHEYRVHLFAGDVLGISLKRRMNSDRRPENFNNQIRSHSNGWVFTHENVEYPTPNAQANVLDVAQRALTALGLHFGAVDVIYNTHRDAAYVLEVNTAPGIEGRTLDAYLNQLRSMVQ